MTVNLLQLWMTTISSWGTTALETGSSSKSVLVLLAWYVSPMTMGIQITDTNPSATFTGQLSDVSQVEKFELSEEAYAQRNGNSVNYYIPSMSLSDSPQTRFSHINNAKNLDGLQKNQIKNHPKPKRTSTSKWVLDAK